MALKHSLLLATWIAMAPAIALAQEGSAKPADAKPAEKAAPMPAASATASSAEVTVPLVGLTQENSAKAEEALEGMTTKAYVCAPCHETHAKPGACPGCKAPLASKEIKPLGSVSAAVDRGTMAFKLQDGARVSLAQIDMALQKGSLKVDREKFQVRGPVLLAISGAKDAAAVEAALKDTKLFSSVQVALDGDSSQVHAWVQTGSTAPTLSAISSALEKQPQGWKIADVIWGAGPEKAS